MKNTRNRYYGDVDSDTLSILAHVLDKPLGYFFSWYLYKEIKQESLTPLENELLLHFKDISDDTLRKLVIDQVKVVGGFDLKELVENSVGDIAFMIQKEKALL